MAKDALATTLKRLDSPPVREPVIVRVPRMNFLMIDGAGDPGREPGFQQAIGTLYGTAWTLKFMHPKGTPPRDTRVPPLEGLFWTKGRRRMVLDTHKGLCWTLMLRQPRGVGNRKVASAVAQLREKKDPPGLDRLRFEPFAEGLVAQVMHVGPYSEELPTIGRLLRFIKEHGYQVSGRHHEVYLGDPRRTKPEKLKTVVRYPVRKR